MMVGGGTGGHVFPALAVAEALRARPTRARNARREIAFIGTEKGVEARAVPAAGYSLHTISAQGFRGAGWWGKARSVWLLGQGVFTAKRLMRRLDPNVVFSIGGYASAGAVLAARLHHCPVVLFEPNAEPGLANRALAPLATRVAVAYPATLDYFGQRAVRTGMPVRAEFFRVPERKHEPPFTLLIFGGSQGALAINAAVVDSLDALRASRLELRFIHQTGQRDFEAVRTAYARRGIGADVRVFIENMADCFAQADLVVCRAGAGTLAELAAAGKAALLIPYPHAAGHQARNAEMLARAGAARVIEQRELTGARLADAVLDLFRRLEQIAAMESRVRAFAVPDAAERIADLIESVAR